MKRYPLQLRFLVPVKAEAGWKTKTQKACCSSSRYTETAQEFCHLSEQRQCHSADTFVHELVRTPADPAAHTHIPDTSMYLYHFHPHKRSFPAVYLWSLPDMPLPFADPAPDSWSSFFPCDLMPPQCVSNAAFAASKCLSHLTGMRLGGPQHMPSVFLDRSFGNFYADFSFPNSPFLSAAFPFLYRRFGNLEDLVGRFQAMSCLSVFYCAFPISFWIAHVLILLVAIPFFNCLYYSTAGLLDKFAKLGISPIPLRKNFCAESLPGPVELLRSVSEGKVKVEYVKAKYK